MPIQHGRSTAIHEDRHHPRPKRRRSIIRTQRSPRPIECILNDIFRVLDVAEHARREAEADAGVPIDECGVRASIPCQGATHELIIGHRRRVIPARREWRHHVSER
jgi:hypothetical protein